MVSLVFGVVFYFSEIPMYLAFLFGGIVLATALAQDLSMFKYPAKIRTLIYTTDAIENFNRQLRKVTKIKGTFVADDALIKILYLATLNITKNGQYPSETGLTFSTISWFVLTTESLLPSDYKYRDFGFYTVFYLLPR